MTTPQMPAPSFAPQGSTLGVPPIDAPYYGAPISAAFSRFWKKYATFSGRASRSEYWKWVLINFVVYLLLGIGTLLLGGIGQAVDYAGKVQPGPLFGIGATLLGLWYFATIVPNIALGIRRLHDVNFSGWMILLNLIPWLGSLLVTVFAILPSNPEGARFDQPRS